MSKLVHNDQTCAVQGRTIHDGILKLYNAIHYIKEHNMDALILSVDHKAAFDVVEWRFVFASLKAFNFGENFIGMIKLMYKQGKVNSSVLVNGYISEMFNVHCGIRQGCPLSGGLYCLTAEVWANFLRKTAMIQGIPLLGENARLSKYADDTNLLLRSFLDVRRSFEIFDLYRQATGSSLAVQKTQILLLSLVSRWEIPEEYKGYIVEELKIYGVRMRASGFDLPSNWEKSDESIVKLTRAFVPYGLSAYGRIHTINIYCLCSLWFVSNIITPSVELIQRAEKIHMVSYKNKCGFAKYCLYAIRQRGARIPEHQGKNHGKQVDYVYKKVDF